MIHTAITAVSIKPVAEFCDDVTQIAFTLEPVFAKTLFETISSQFDASLNICGHYATAKIAGVTVEAHGCHTEEDTSYVYFDMDGVGVTIITGAENTLLLNTDRQYTDEDRLDGTTTPELREDFWVEPAAVVRRLFAA